MPDITITLTDDQEAGAELRITGIDEEGAEVIETITEYCQRMVDRPISISIAQAKQKRFDAVGARQDAMLTAEEAR
jgi:hypothetical protein